VDELALACRVDEENAVKKGTFTPGHEAPHHATQLRWLCASQKRPRADREHGENSVVPVLAAKHLG
jgi:hypothetical protein